MNSLQSCAVVLSLCLAGGCTPARRQEAAYRPHSSSRVTAYELAQCRPSATLLEAVEDLRPSFLGTRCRGHSGQPVTVVVDGLIMGGIEALREYRVESIRSVERLCDVDAMQRLGSTVAGNVILVTTGVPRPRGTD